MPPVSRLRISSKRTSGLLIGYPVTGVKVILEGYAVIRAEVPLKEMFGYSMTVRSLTAGKASFTMEFATNRPVPASQQTQLTAKAVR